MKPDRWTQHHHKCGMGEIDRPYCVCPPFWPRPAAYWNGHTAIGRKQVETLIRLWRAAEPQEPAKRTR